MKWAATAITVGGLGLFAIVLRLLGPNKKQPAIVSRNPSLPAQSGVFATRAEAAQLGPEGWVTWRGKQITALPLIDSDNPTLFARLRYSDIASVLARLGARLMTEKELSDLHDDAQHPGMGVTEVEPCILPTSAMIVEMGPQGASEDDISYQRRIRADIGSKEWATIHDACVHSQLEKAGWDGKTPVSNAGKNWLDGDYNFGWWVNGRLQQPKSSAHRGGNYTDYSQLTMLVKL